LENLKPADLVETITDDYLAYSMAIIVGRAIPSITDGMKPSQRRILTAMKWLGLSPDNRYMKSARVEGEVMGKLHPHGSAYGTMVTLAAPWNNNLPLIDGQGNWGSSVDSAASSRYTECKLTTFTWDVLLDDTDIWLTRDNYDGTLQEPIELNVKVPTVLLNGQEGIGVGYATKIPSHNLRDICDSIINNTPLNPDFSTGCDIVSDTGLTQYRITGSGPIRCRAKVSTGLIEKTGRTKERGTLTFTNLPPQTNPEKIGQQIKDALDKGQLANITEVTDESDRSGDRVVVVTKPGSDIKQIEKQLYAFTDLDSKFSARTLVIEGTRPLELNTTELINKWKTWRLGVLERKFQHERNSKEFRLEIVTGLIKAIDKLDLVIKVIRASASPKEALIELVTNRTLKFTIDQAKAILDMKLRSLTSLDADELQTEKEKLNVRLVELTALIENYVERKGHMLLEIKTIGDWYGEARRSTIIDIPEGITKQNEPGKTRTISAPKPRYVKLDFDKGIITQEKNPRGCFIINNTDKIITVTQDAKIKKLPANFKGPVADGYMSILLGQKESCVIESSYLVVFKLEESLKAMVVSGQDLCKTTSKGKSLLAPGSEIVYFGQDNYEVHFKSGRKKPVTLTLQTKPGRPGGKGIKIAALTDIGSGG